MFAIYGRLQLFPTLVVLLIIALYVSAIIHQIYLRPPYPDSKDAWRLASADQPNTVTVAWADNSQWGHCVILNLVSGKWTYDAGYVQGFSFEGPGRLNDDMLNPEQMSGIKEWVEMLPPPDTKAVPEVLRVRIVVNLNGTQHVYVYARPTVTKVMSPLSKILGRDFLVGMP